MTSLTDKTTRLLRWLARNAANRPVGALLALYAFGTDWLTGWHGMNFAIRGMLDEPAHLATALIILGAVVRFRGSPPDPRFIATMLICSVAIDMDHLPAEFGSNALTDGTPRPYTHALWVVIVLTLAWAVARFLVTRSGRRRPATIELVLAGAAWGMAAHFVRDIATAPMSFWLPVTADPVQVPYWWYVAALLVILALPPTRLLEAAPPLRRGVVSRDYRAAASGGLPPRGIAGQEYFAIMAPRFGSAASMCLPAPPRTAL